MTVDWASLICEKDGRISLHRVRKLSAILMGWLGVCILVVGALVTSIGLDKLALVSAVLVAPMTGGQVADALSGKFLADKVQAGTVPGRRSSDGQPDRFQDDETE